MEALLEFDRNPRPEFKHMVRQRSTGIFGSQLAEDLFNYQKNSSVIKGKRKFRRPEKAMGVVIAKEVVSTVHRFQSITVDASLPKQSIRLPKETFQPVESEASFPAGGIVGTSAKPPWYSPGVANYGQRLADLDMLLIASDSGEWDRLTTAWCGQLCSNEHRLLIRPVGRVMGWHFAMHHYTDSSVLAWPALQIEVPNHPNDHFFVFNEQASPKLLLVSCVGDWEGTVYHWRSPLWQQKEYPNAKGRLAPAVRAFPDKGFGVDTLLKICAKSAFFKLDKLFINRLAKHLGLEVPAGAALFDLVFTVVQQILTTTDVQTLDLVSHRMANMASATAWCDELLQVEEAAKCLDTHDEKVLNDEKKDIQQNLEEERAFRAQYRTKRRAVAPIVAAEGGKKRKTTKASASLSSAPTKLPLSTID